MVAPTMRVQVLQARTIDWCLACAPMVWQFRYIHDKSLRSGYLRCALSCRNIRETSRHDGGNKRKRGE